MRVNQPTNSWPGLHGYFFFYAKAAESRESPAAKLVQRLSPDAVTSQTDWVI